MLEFSKNLQRLISVNKLEQAIDEFQNTLDKFPPKGESAKSEQKDLRTMIIASSQRLYLVKDKEVKGNISDEELMRERRAISNQIMEILNDLDKYPAFSEYLIDWDDEQTWKRTNNVNAIEAYREYLNKYPTGKYAEDAKKYIDMLKLMEQQKTKELEEKIQQELNQPKQVPQQVQNQHNADESAGKNVVNEIKSNPQESVSSGIYIISIVASIFIPLVGLVAGAYFYYSKNGAAYKYDESSRKKGRILLIVGGIMAFIYIIYYA